MGLWGPSSVNNYGHARGIAGDKQRHLEAYMRPRRQWPMSLRGWALRAFGYVLVFSPVLALAVCLVATGR